VYASFLGRVVFAGDCVDDGIMRNHCDRLHLLYLSPSGDAMGYSKPGRTGVAVMGGSDGQCASWRTGKLIEKFQ